jgi:glyoxylase-like metal-dependent hydrolase (beta-lactamase superfamily II)
MNSDTTVKTLSLYMDKLGIPTTLHPVLLVDDSGATLVDSGYPLQFTQFKEALAEVGVALSQIRRVIITHSDWDHIGLMADIIRARPDLAVYAHAQEKPFLEGDLPSLKLPPEKIAARLATVPAATRSECAAMFAAIPTFTVTHTLADGLLPFHGGLRIIHTPGHTPGHICVYVQQKRLLIPGDALRVIDGELVGPAPEYTPDMAAAKRSLNRLTIYGIDQVISFHGGPYAKNVGDRIRKLAGV